SWPRWDSTWPGEGRASYFLQVQREWFMLANTRQRRNHCSQSASPDRRAVMQSSSSRLLAWLFAIVATAVVAAVPASAASDNVYSVHPLVSNVPGAAPTTDPNLVNAWGLTASATSPWWVADNGTNVSTIYQANGTIVPLVVQVPIRPTGAVFWSFTTRAVFVFDTEAGQIRGWHPSQGNQTVVLADRSAVGAIYKGLAIASTTAGDRFYATDFHNGRVDVFDGNFNLITSPGA